MIDGPGEEVSILETGFGRGAAVLGYALLIASLFTIWITGVVGLVLAWMNRRDPDLVTRSHFRFQLRVAEIGGLLSGLGIAGVLWGGWSAFAPVLQGGDFDAGRLFAAGGWVLLGLLLWLGSSVWTLVAGVFGLVRLLAGKPIGRIRGAVATGAGLTTY